MRYPTQVEEFNLGKWGTVKFANWLHPHEHRKVFTERDINWLAQFISPGDTVIDVGSFTGDTTLPMAVAAGKEGQVHAFEPNPASLEVLLQNSTLNPEFAKIIVYPYAIGVEKGDAIFRYHCEQINGGLLTDGIQVHVKRARLDECDVSGRISFVKFDCEGEDAILLYTYFDWLKAQDAVVQVERFPGMSQNHYEEFWRIIKNYGTPFLKDDWSFTELKRLPTDLVDIVIRPK